MAEMKLVVQRLALTLVITVLGFAACEWAARHSRFFDQPAHILTWSNAPGIFYTNRPHYSEGLYTINDYGLRGPAVNPASVQDKTVVLSLGDSTTFGLNVPVERAYPHQLELTLNRETPRYAVINAGAPGYNLWDYAATLKRFEPMYHPRVVTVGLYMNDHVPWTLKNKLRFVLEDHSVFLFNLFRLRDKLKLYREAGANWEQKLTAKIDHDGTAKGTVGQKNPQDLAAIPAYLSDLNDTTKWRRACDVMGEMKAYCDARGIRLVVAVLPIQFQIRPNYTNPEPQRTIEAYLTGQKIPFCDMRTIFAAHYVRGENCYPGMSDLAHFDARGHAWVAAALAPLVKAAATRR